MWLTGLVAPWHVGSSQTRARTRVPCIGRRILNHCATREALPDILCKNVKAQEKSAPSSPPSPPTYCATCECPISQGQAPPALLTATLWPPSGGEMLTPARAQPSGGRVQRRRLQRPWGRGEHLGPCKGTFGSLPKWSSWCSNFF